MGILFHHFLKIYLGPLHLIKIVNGHLQVTLSFPTSLFHLCPDFLFLFPVILQLWRKEKQEKVEEGVVSGQNEIRNKTGPGSLAFASESLSLPQGMCQSSSQNEYEDPVPQDGPGPRAVELAQPWVITSWIWVLSLLLLLVRWFTLSSSACRSSRVFWKGRYTCVPLEPCRNS